MKKTTIRLYVFLATLVLVSSVVSAGMIIPASDKAIEHSPAIGAGGDLERVDFIHYAKPSNPAKPSKVATCYKLLGVKWTGLPVNYVINPYNTEGIDEGVVVNTIATSTQTWDQATSAPLFNAPLTGEVQYGVANGINAIDFGPLDIGIIGVTSIWYSRVTKQIVEFDMRFNNYYNWGDATSDSSLMDLQNIATHELGHAVGMGDVYTSSCTAVTMYGYSNTGDISKRDLEPADITGLQKMYGA